MTQPTNALLPVLGRIFWMMVGPMLLAILAVSIVSIGNGWFTAADFGFLGVLGLLITARWLEFHAGSPQTSTGEPATPDHLRRYVLGALLIGVGIWVAANLLGNYWMVR
jgi:hypothetical protein